MDTETMNLVITSVVVPVLIALVALFVQWTNAKAIALKEQLHNEALNKYIDIADEAVCTAVGAVAQVMVDGLKAAAADGVLSSEEAKAAFDEAKNRALAIMGTLGREAVKELYGDFDAWLAGKIEFYVGARKQI